MKYEIKVDKEKDSYQIINESGSVIKTGDTPINHPDDIIDAILDDMGVGDPKKKAFKTLFKKDWEVTEV